MGVRYQSTSRLGFYRRASSWGLANLSFVARRSSPTYLPDERDLMQPERISVSTDQIAQLAMLFPANPVALTLAVESQGVGDGDFRLPISCNSPKSTFCLAGPDRTTAPPSQMRSN